MIQYKCLTISADASSHAKATIATFDGTKALGFRFESKGPGKHVFAPIEDIRVKDYVLQPVLGGVIIFVDPDSLAKGYGTDIHLDGREFVFEQSDRVMPKIAEKTDEKKAEEKARRAASRATQGMKQGAEKTRIVRAAKEASLAADEAKALTKKNTVPKASVKKPGSIETADVSKSKSTRKPASKTTTSVKKVK